MMVPVKAHLRSIFCKLMLAGLLLSCNTETRTQITKLAELQRDYSMRYLEPEPHMALAKYYFDHGDPIEAFFITEAARRGRFEEKIFKPAFYRAFDGFDNSKRAETRLLAEFARNPNSTETIHGLADIYISRDDWPNAKRYLLAGIQKKPVEYRFTSGLALVLDREGKHQEADQLIKDYVRKFPDTPESYALKAELLMRTNPDEAKLILTKALKLFPTDGQLLFDLGMVYQGEDYQKAEEAFVKAAELSPKSESIQTWAGRFFFKVKADNRRALRYYLNAYFLNPDAYETEYVESRIQKIVDQLASKKFTEQTRAGVQLVDILADSDPRVVSYALNQMAGHWQPAYVAPVVQVMGHPSAGLRWEATQILKTRVDNSFDAQLKALLKDDDPRKRGLAAYIAVYRWKSSSFGILKSLLSDESQLVRFDAISALMMEGGPAGRKVALAHAAHEPNSTLKKLITTSNPAGDRQ